MKLKPENPEPPFKVATEEPTAAELVGTPKLNLPPPGPPKRQGALEGCEDGAPNIELVFGAPKSEGALVLGKEPKRPGVLAGWEAAFGAEAREGADAEVWGAGAGAEVEGMLKLGPACCMASAGIGVAGGVSEACWGGGMQAAACSTA